MKDRWLGLSSSAKGVLLLIGVCLVATFEVAILRMLGERVGMGQALLVRSSMQIVLAIWMSKIWAGQGLAVLRTGRLGGHLFRSSMAAVAWYCYYTSFKVLPMGLATTLTFSSQFFVLMMMWPILRERVSRGSVVATSVGFMGVVIASGLLQPQQLDWRVVFGFTSALLGAVMIIMTRSLTRTEATGTIVFYMPLLVFATSIPQAWMDWRPLSAEDWGWILLFGLGGTVASWGHVEAYRHALPSVLAPVTYLRLATGLAVGAWIFNDALTVSMAVGVALILIGAAYPRR